MSASKQAKEAGLTSLAHVSQMTGTSVQTLTNWHHNKPKLFKIVLTGCLNQPFYSERRKLNN